MYACMYVCIAIFFQAGMLWEQGVSPLTPASAWLLDHLASNQQQLVAGACSGRPRLTSPFGLVRRDVSHSCRRICAACYGSRQEG